MNMIEAIKAILTRRIQDINSDTLANHRMRISLLSEEAQEVQGRLAELRRMMTAELAALESVEPVTMQFPDTEVLSEWVGLLVATLEKDANG